MIKIGQSIAIAWEVFTANAGVLIGALVLSVMLNLIPNGLLNVFTWIDRFDVVPTAVIAAVPFGLAIVSYALTSLTTVGYLIITLKLCAGQTASVADLFGGTRVLLGFSAASVVFTLITSFSAIVALIVFFVIYGEEIPAWDEPTFWLGAVLLVVAGLLGSLYWGAQFGYYGFGVLEQGLAPIASLRYSAQLTQGLRWPLVGFSVVLALLNLAGLLVCGAGLLVTLPLSAVAYTWVYLQIAGKQA